MPRLLEEVRGQRNPTEEKQINEAAERKRQQEGLQRLREFAG